MNVNRALELGKQQQKEFETGWSDSFYKPLKRIVVPITADRKSIEVDGQMIIDTEVFYARALVVKVKDRHPQGSVIAHGTLTSCNIHVRWSRSYMRATQTSNLKNSLAFVRSHSCVTDDSYFLDVCVILWAVDLPTAKHAVLKDYIQDWCISCIFSSVQRAGRCVPHIFWSIQWC